MSFFVFNLGVLTDLGVVEETNRAAILILQSSNEVKPRDICWGLVRNLWVFFWLFLFLSFRVRAKALAYESDGDELKRTIMRFNFFEATNIDEVDKKTIGTAENEILVANSYAEVTTIDAQIQIIYGRFNREWMISRAT
ncbi:hypothetical protein V6N13_131502 [Hibiscus sabdariffa]|uniref:Uncharacterized protein n=1 Tax=Hibiscus sabdariffa TaxID=183260 RepID=A0ABR2D8G5_9ROSI